MLFSLIAALLFAPPAAPQQPQRAHAPEPVQLSLIRVGESTPALVPTFVDGVPITPLRNHRMVVLRVTPGHHQLSAGEGDSRVTCDFTSEEGKFLYFELKLTTSASAHALLYDLQQVEMITDGDSQVVPLSPATLASIYSKARNAPAAAAHPKP